MKMWKRFVSVLLVAVLLLSPTQLFAAESVVENTPDAWAMQEVFFAEVFGLCGPSIDKDFKQEMPFENFAVLHNAFCARLAVEDAPVAPADGIVTRGYVIEALYNTISIVAEKDKEAMSALDYFVGNGLINGRADGNYALDKPCTAQEALVFAVRAYVEISAYLDRGGKGFLWKVSDTDNAVYLLGSIHVADYSLYPLSPAIMDAFADSDKLAVEVNMLEIDMMEMMALVAGLAMYDDGTELIDVLGEEIFHDLSLVMAELGYAPSIINQMKPWYIQQLLSGLSEVASGETSALGIDMFFMVLAILEDMPIVSLETAADQFEALASLSEEAQVTMLLQELATYFVFSEEERLVRQAEGLNSLLEAWRLADEDMIDEAIGYTEAEDEISLEYLYNLNTARNQKMLPQIALFLEEEDENVMVIVGTMHMLYDVGLVQGMEDLGYTVERIR